MRFESSLSLNQCTLLPICTVATVQLLYAIRILTVTISVHTVTNMYGSHSCYSHVPVERYSYFMRFESSLSLYQCTLLPICTVATAVKAMYQYFSTLCWYDATPHSPASVITPVNLYIPFWMSLLLQYVASIYYPSLYWQANQLIQYLEQIGLLVPVKYPLAARITIAPLTVYCVMQFGSLGTKPWHSDNARASLILCHGIHKTSRHLHTNSRQM